MWKHVKEDHELTLDLLEKDIDCRKRTFKSAKSFQKYVVLEEILIGAPIM
jgi:hypothetical protein